MNMTKAEGGRNALTVRLQHWAYLTNGFSEVDDIGTANGCPKPVAWCVLASSGPATVERFFLTLSKVDPNNSHRHRRGWKRERNVTGDHPHHVKIPDKFMDELAVRSSDNVSFIIQVVHEYHSDS
jgi:hypothetical protein